MCNMAEMNNNYYYTCTFSYKCFLKVGCVLPFEFLLSVVCLNSWLNFCIIVNPHGDKIPTNFLSTVINDLKYYKS